jgi:predicted nucleic acid-binding protein
VRTLAEGPEPWAILWPSLYGFLVTVTNPLVFKTPTPFDRAVDQVDAWLESPSLVALTEGRGGLVYWKELSYQLLASKATGQVVNHARVAALCLHHGVSELWSADRDYSSFPSLKVRNPLVGR